MEITFFRNTPLILMTENKILLLSLIEFFYLVGQSKSLTIRGFRK